MIDLLVVVFGAPGSLEALRGLGTGARGGSQHLLSHGPGAASPQLWPLTPLGPRPGGCPPE